MKDRPARNRLADDEDELDGCSIDFSPDAIHDDEILGIVLGDDRAKQREYRKLFRKRRLRRLFRRS